VPDHIEEQHHHHFVGPVWTCTGCGFTVDPEEDAVAIVLAQEDGWHGTNVRNTFAWELHLERARRVIATLDHLRQERP
jgi:hypothetical protein